MSTLRLIIPPIAVLAAASLAVTQAGAANTFFREDRKDGVRALDIFARCAVDRRYAKARAAIAAPFGSPEQTSKLSQVVLRRGSEDPCFSTGVALQSLSFSDDLFAGALATALAMRDYPDLAAVIGSVAADEATERAAEARMGGNEAFGRCLVRRNLNGAAALIRAPLGSGSAKEAINAIRADLGPCLPSGTSLRLEPLIVRNAAAVAAYNLAQAIVPRGFAGVRSTPAPAASSQPSTSGTVH